MSPRKVKQTISTTQAIDIADTMGIPMSLPTLISIIKKQKLGFQLNGKFSDWKIDQEKWERYLKDATKND